MKQKLLYLLAFAAIFYTSCKKDLETTPIPRHRSQL